MAPKMTVWRGRLESLFWVGMAVAVVYVGSGPYDLITVIIMDGRLNRRGTQEQRLAEQLRPCDCCVVACSLCMAATSCIRSPPVGPVGHIHNHGRARSFVACRPSLAHTPRSFLWLGAINILINILLFLYVFVW